MDLETRIAELNAMINACEPDLTDIHGDFAGMARLRRRYQEALNHLLAEQRQQNASATTPRSPVQIATAQVLVQDDYADLLAKHRRIRSRNEGSDPYVNAYVETAQDRAERERLGRLLMERESAAATKHLAAIYSVIAKLERQTRDREERERQAREELTERQRRAQEHALGERQRSSAGDTVSAGLVLGAHFAAGMAMGIWRGLFGRRRS